MFLSLCPIYRKPLAGGLNLAFRVLFCHFETGTIVGEYVSAVERLSLRPEGIGVTLTKYFPLLILASSSLWAVPRLRLSSTVVGPVTVAQGAAAAAQDLEAYSVADRDVSSETENLRLTFSSTAPWVSAAASTARTCVRRAGICVPIRLTFSSINQSGIKTRSIGNLSRYNLVRSYFTISS